MKKSLLANFTVIVISLGGAAFCTKLLLDDYNNTLQGDEKDVAGILAEANTDVKRKLGDNLLWDKIPKQSKLYWNDSVQTDEKSQAVIRLNGGTEIKLGVASLVSLEKDNGQLALNLKSGALLVDNKVKSNQLSKIKVNGVELDNSKSKSLAINVDDKKGEIKAVETNQDGTGKEITISKDGKKEEKEIPALLQNPPPLFRTWTSFDAEKINFSWTSKDPSAVLEVAKDKDFSKVVFRKEISGSSHGMELDPGTYFWRVKVSAAESKTFSESRSVEIIQMKKPAPLAPSTKDKVVYRTEIPTVEFSWKPAEGANHYVFEIAKDKDFNLISYSTETTQTSVKTSKLFEGPVYWRVTAVYVNLRQPSSISEFEISRQEIKPPSLLEPASKFVLDYKSFAKKGGLPFRWKAESGEPSRFVLSTTEDLKEEVSAFETSQTETLVTEKLRPGTYYWSVGYKNNAGHWEYKETRRFEVDVLIAPLESPEILTRKKEFDVDLETVDLQWSPVPGATQYHFKLVRVDGDAEKTIVEESSTELQKSKIELEDGKYKYLVSTIDAAGRESKPTEKYFKVTRSPELEAPDFEMPEVQ